MALNSIKTPNKQNIPKLNHSCAKERVVKLLLTLIEAVGEMTLLAVKDLARRYCYYSVSLWHLLISVQILLTKKIAEIFFFLSLQKCAEILPCLYARHFRIYR